MCWSESLLFFLLNIKFCSYWTQNWQMSHKILLNWSLHTTINWYQLCHMEMEWSDQGLHIYCLAVPFTALHFRGRIKRQSQQMTASEWSLIIVSCKTGVQNQLIFSRLDLELSYKNLQDFTAPKPAKRATSFYCKSQQRTEQRTSNNFLKCFFPQSKHRLWSKEGMLSNLTKERWDAASLVCADKHNSAAHWTHPQVLGFSLTWSTATRLQHLNTISIHETVASCT